jgi:hypothetical protein
VRPETFDVDAVDAVDAGILGQDIADAVGRDRARRGYC